MSSRPMWKGLGLLFAFAALSGCATTQKNGDEKVAAPGAPAAPLVSEAELKQEIQAADQGIEPEPHSEVPLEINGAVERWIEYFTVRDRERFRRYLENSLKYKDQVQAILKKEGVPAELHYLALIESGYVTYARSRRRAVGVWQFMRATGRKFGLKVEGDVDERRDVLRATVAAARFLRDLKERLGSWYLAMAAYNAGEGRIRRGIRRGHSRDFWELVRKRVLPRETKSYVPKFLAASIVARNAATFGFTEIKFEKYPEVELVEVGSSIALTEIAAKSDLPLEFLRELNPGLIRDMTPRSQKGYSVWVPKEKAAQLNEVRATLVKHEGKELPLLRRVASAEPRGGDFHRVRRGETLASISRRYGLSVEELKRLNGLSDSRITRGQRLKIKAVL